MQLSSKTFAKAAKIAEKIESLEKQLSVILKDANSLGNKQGAPKAAPKRRSSLPKNAVCASAAGFQDGRGTLRPAVVAILKSSTIPLKTADIYDKLVAQGYKFTFKEPKKVLGIRLYKMLGVQPLGGGFFRTK